ncbi:MAG: putative baseplate assembly protein [Bacillota bacterium]
MPLPIPNLDDKTFAQLIAEAVRLIPQYAPEWTDHNLSDPGITFLELFAWLAETQIYSLNQITPRHYLKYLRLLGLTPLPAAPARALVNFTAADTHVLLPRSTQAVTAEGIVFETDEAVDVLPVSLERVVVFDGYSFLDCTDASRHTGVFYHAFGEKARADAGMYLGLSFDGAAVKGKELKLYLCHYDKDLPPLPAPADPETMRLSARVRWEYLNGAGWFEFKPTGDGLVENFACPGGLVLQVPANIETSGLYEFGEYFWIRAEVVQEGYEIPPRLDTILLNTTGATQGVFVEEVVGTGNSLPGQTLSASMTPVLSGSRVLEVEKAGGGWEPWTGVDDLEASRLEDRHYLLDAQTGTVTFGDGINGMVLPSERRIRMRYRSGGGPAGNVAAGTITVLPGVTGVSVSNPFPASGGGDPETLAAAVLRARETLKSSTRAVTADDFAAIAGHTPGLRVARAKAVADPARNVVKVIVVPFSFDNEPVPGNGFLQTVKEHLNRHRLITTVVETAPPRYVRVSVSLSVRADPGAEPGAVKEGVLTALRRFLHPLQGGVDGAGWEFGRGVFQSELYAAAAGANGVDCITGLSFFLDGTIDETTLVCSGRHAVDVAAPETACRGATIHASRGTRR